MSETRWPDRRAFGVASEDCHGDDGYAVVNPAGGVVRRFRGPNAFDAAENAAGLLSAGFNHAMTIAGGDHLLAIWKVRFGDRRPAWAELAALFRFIAATMAAGAVRPGAWEHEIYEKLLAYVTDEQVLGHDGGGAA